MKKAPGQLHVTRFVKSFTPIRFQNFASLVVDDVTKMCFSTPVLVFNPRPHLKILDDLVILEQIFHSK